MKKNLKKTIWIITGIFFIPLISFAVTRGQLMFPLDNESKQIIERAADDFLPDKIFDLIWKRTFHWLTLFDSIDGYDTTGSVGGTVSLGSADVSLTTAPTATSTAEIKKQSAWQGLMTFSQKSSMRTAFNVSIASSSEIYLVVGTVVTGGTGYGFYAATGTLYGISNNGTVATTTPLITLTTDNYNVEARYTPNRQIDFLVGGPTDARPEVKGTIKSGLPSPATTTRTTLMDIQVRNGNTMARVLKTSFFEYLQYRNILR